MQLTQLIASSRSINAACPGHREQVATSERSSLNNKPQSQGSVLSRLRAKRSKTAAARPDSETLNEHSYRIRVRGHLDDSWSAWFDGMTVTTEEAAVTVLKGPLPDQAALHGTIAKIRNLGLQLISIEPMTVEE